MSHQYDKIIESTNELKNNYTNLEKRVQKNSDKSEQNANYPRRDCLELSGIPVCPNHNGEEDCKKMVMDICKELHLSHCRYDFAEFSSKFNPLQTFRSQLVGQVINCTKHYLRKD